MDQKHADARNSIAVPASLELSGGTPEHRRAAGKAACPAACNCLADQGEKMMTPADYEEADKAAEQDKMTAEDGRLSKYFPACARQAPGR